GEPDRARVLRKEAEWGERVRRERVQCARRGGDLQPDRTGGCLPVAEHEVPVRSERLFARDELALDDGDERLEDERKARQPPPGDRPMDACDERMLGTEVLDRIRETQQ